MFFDSIICRNIAQVIDVLILVGVYTLFISLSALLFQLMDCCMSTNPTKMILFVFQILLLSFLFQAPMTICVSCCYQSSFGNNMSQHMDRLNILLIKLLYGLMACMVLWHAGSFCLLFTCNLDVALIMRYHAIYYQLSLNCFIRITALSLHQIVLYTL